MPIPSEPHRYQVAVRELCEFVAKQGDLDLRFTPTPTAQEGIAGHTLVATRRPAGYLSEVTLSGQHGLLSVKGRADGYLQDVADHFERAHPGVPVVRQQRGMSEAAQHAFLARMTPTSQGIGFAVLGGSFSEGVDLPGQRLIGAFIATLGMPQVNPVNEHIKARLDEIVGDGHAFHYLYPGLQKVVQAAGRVIRTTEDQGVVHLLDDRYGRGEVRGLLPEWWVVA